VVNADDVLMALPAYGSFMPHATMTSLVSCHGRFGWRMALVHDHPIAMARNLLANGFMQTNADVLLFVDQDMVFSPDDAMWVVVAARERQEPVGALYMSRRRPHNPIARAEGLREKIDEGGIQGVDGIGMGLCAIPRRIFEEIKFPWFRTRDFKSGDHIGEDYFFCEKVLRAGFHVWLDTTTRVRHVASLEIGFDDWEDSDGCDPEPRVGAGTEAGAAEPGDRGSVR
jgi:hypothetical protein